MKLPVPSPVRMVIGVAACAVAASLLVAASASAGSTTVVFVGLVKDTAGNAIPDAQLDVVLQEQGTKVSLKTDGKGNFQRIGMRPGMWDLTVHKDGFQDWSGPVQLKLGERVPVEVTLAPAASAAPAAAAVTTGFSLGDVKVSKEAGEAFMAAQEALTKNDMDGARAALTTFLSLETSLAAPYFLLGQLEREAGDNKKAMELIGKGLALKADDVTGWLALGELQADTGDAAGSVASFRKAAEAAPDDPRAHKKIAVALVQTQDYAGAAQALETYLRLAPDAPDAAEKKQFLDEIKKLAAAPAKK